VRIFSPGFSGLFCVDFFPRYRYISVSIIAARRTKGPAPADPTDAEVQGPLLTAGTGPRPNDRMKEVPLMQRSLLFSILCLAALLLNGCVAKSDYLQKQVEANTVSQNLGAMAAENSGLKDQIERAHADREREKTELNARLDAQTAEMARTAADTTRTTEELMRTIEELKNRNLELEGDKQMLQESIALLRRTKEELTSKNADLESEKHMLQDSIARLNETKEEAKEEAVQTVSKTYEDLLSEMKEEIEQGQIAITELQGKLTMDVVDKILFDSGQAEVKPEGLKVLKRVVEILKTVTDKTIRIEGHTDNVRIGGGLAKRYATNWELSAARAINVTRYLEKEGVDPTLLSAAAFGEYQPVSDNETPEGRAKNRRIAIILLPMEGR
jgi:chemotaxis protein MotB